MKEQTLAKQLQTEEGRVEWIEDQATRWGFFTEVNQATLLATNDPHIKDKKAFLGNLIKRVKEFDILKKTQFFWNLKALLKQCTGEEESKEVERFVKKLKKSTGALS